MNATLTACKQTLPMISGVMRAKKPVFDKVYMTNIQGLNVLSELCKRYSYSRTMFSITKYAYEHVNHIRVDDDRTVKTDVDLEDVLFGMFNDYQPDYDSLLYVLYTDPRVEDDVGHVLFDAVRSLI